jgi:hypothetical protein
MTDADRESRRRALYATLGFCQLEEHPAMPEVSALKRWLSTCTGIGDIVVGMERQGYAVSLRQIPRNGWTASFADHRLLAPAGFANSPTPFGAVQQAAWRALNAGLLPASGGEEMVEPRRLLHPLPAECVCEG